MKINDLLELFISKKVIRITKKGYARSPKWKNYFSQVE